MAKRGPKPGFKQTEEAKQKISVARRKSGPLSKEKRRLKIERAYFNMLKREQAENAQKDSTITEAYKQGMSLGQEIAHMQQRRLNGDK